MRYCVLFILLCCCPAVWAQEYSYTHYNISQGLAGSTVYCITQDKDGYIWTGTETGLSRFDGEHFRNFTTADGLPDIEILQLFTDSKGRVWMAPFKKSICYYYQGKIHNQQNDPLLARIQLRANVEGFAEDSQGDVLLTERVGLYMVTANNSVHRLDSIDGAPIRDCHAVSVTQTGDFVIQDGGRIVAFNSSKVLWRKIIEEPPLNPNQIRLSGQWSIRMEDTRLRYVIESYHSNHTIAHAVDSHSYTFVNFSTLGDSLAYYNTIDGTFEYNMRTGETRHYMPGKTVSRVFRDAAGSLWFTTLGDGLYRLNSDEFRTLLMPAGKRSESAIHAITRLDGYLWACNNYNYFYRLSIPDLRMKMVKSFTNFSKVRNLYLDSVGPGRLLSAGDMGVQLTSPTLEHLNKADQTVKAACRINDHELLEATTRFAGIFDLQTFRVTDTLWKERTTAVCYYKDTIYIGTLGGLYSGVRGKPLVWRGTQIPFLQKRISSIVVSADGILWVASYDDAGIVGVKDNRVVASITKQQGLTSDICRTLYLHKNELWVGTDNGLNKILLDQPGYPITRYTTNDGLGSSLINCIFADGDMIYVGTSAGMSFFNESRVTAVGECRLYLQSVVNSGKDRLEDTAHLLLPYRNPGILLEYAAISYRSVGDITYHYRMLGLDTGWRETKETFLDYPSLPTGDYQWQLYAVNKTGLKSETITLRFTVITPYWKTIWFLGLMVVLALAILWLLISWRIQRIRNEQKRKEELLRKIGELENKALQSQMNPHFIFNCLNSIQLFIFEQDVKATNKYIAGFARLIRATLYNSSRAFITITDEVEYLSTYLTLEQMRFKDKMDYFIEIDPLIDKDNSLVPPMLIQPYVENSMRHGLRHKMKGKGYIRIRMRQENELLVIEIEDNGIGRQKAMQFKTGEHIEYQSKGMSLTADRIRMIGTVYGADINVQVEDLVDDRGESMGTRVVMRLPPF